MPLTPSVVTSTPFESRYFTMFRFAATSCSRVWPCHGLMGERNLMLCLPPELTTGNGTALWNASMWIVPASRIGSSSHSRSSRFCTRPFSHSAA